MEKINKNFTIKLILITMIALLANSFFNSGFHVLIDSWIRDSSTESREIIKELFERTCNPVFLVHSIMSNFVQFLTVALIIIVNHIISYKNRFYSYNVGRNQNYLKRMLIDGIKISMLLMVVIYIVCLVVALVGFSINKNWADTGNIYSNTYIKLGSDASNFWFNVMFYHWITIFTFMITSIILIITSSFLIRNKVLLLSCTIFILFGSQLFIDSKYTIFHQISFLLNVASDSTVMAYINSACAIVLSTLSLWFVKYYDKV